MLTNLIVKNENTNGVTGLCLQVRDLVISKYVAGRPKDLQFTGELARLKMIDRSVLTQRLEKTDLSRSERSRIRSRIEANFGSDQRVKKCTSSELWENWSRYPVPDLHVLPARHSALPAEHQPEPRAIIHTDTDTGQQSCAMWAIEKFQYSFIAQIT